MSKSLIIVGIFSLMVVATLGTLFFVQKNNGNENDLIAKKNKLQGDLIIAKKKLNKDQNTLDIMTDNLKSSFPFAVAIQDQMKKSSNIVGQTDFMFTDPDGLNPELIIKNLPAVILVNKERKNINLLLEKWQDKIDILSVEKIDAKESEQIKKDVQTIKTYLADLSHLVGTLTPENSGISQFQIYIYISTLPSANAIDEVLKSLQAAIDDSKNNNSQLDIHSVTADDVVVQQGIVEKTQAEVTALEEQLAQIEKQIQQSSSVSTSTPASNSNTDSNSSSVPDITSGSADTTSTSSATNSNSNTTSSASSSNNSDQTNIGSGTDSNSGNQNQNTNNAVGNSNGTGSYDNGTSSNSNTSNRPGIIIQPGPPRLIEGANQY
ncbi:MAG: hypothetical protein NTZ87_04190 [Candidatus Nomurabacteria bacterium]|nr:hypothetical protein [Candidatus Nomurabacteria bacterium]